MKNFNNNTKERVEVMALFGYEMTPCEPLSFKRRGESEPKEVTELLGSQVRFGKGFAIHIFEVMVGKRHCHLEFDSKTLAWYLAA
ncbi:hypothetical protein IJN73_01620 [Candidatus Saccharibacteria bacterium]|nr:hypothetical protein [Candidatus Saccharibacteria bacterium]MBR3414424.1 hypothetical protein [Candidatus Saccharibacteria bacterium]